MIGKNNVSDPFISALEKPQPMELGRKGAAKRERVQSRRFCLRVVLEEANTSGTF